MRLKTKYLYIELNKKYRYIQIWRLEVFFPRKFTFDLIKCGSGCMMLELGFVGFTILCGDCVRD